MNLFLAGGLIGGSGAAGLVLAVLASPPLRRRTLADRIARYLADSTRTSQLLLRSQPNTASAFGRLTAPLVADAVKMIDRIVGGQASVRRRLDSLDSSMTVEQFRVDQVLWGAIATAAGLALGLLAVVFGQTNPVTLVLLIAVCAIGGVLARDWWLSQVVAKRDAEILTEFPVVAEMLALAVTAGEGPAGAIERISRLAHGHLVDQLTGILADTRSGTPLLVALTNLRDRTNLEPLSDFSTAWRWPSNAAHPWPTSCARRPPMSGRWANAS